MNKLFKLNKAFFDECTPWQSQTIATSEIMRRSDDQAWKATGDRALIKKDSIFLFIELLNDETCYDVIGIYLVGEDLIRCATQYLEPIQEPEFETP